MNTASTIHTSLTNLTSPIDASRFAHLSSRRPAPARAPIASRKIADLGHGRNVFWLRCTAPAFERDVLTLRSRAYGRPAAACRDAFDDDGDHYVSYQKGVPMYDVRASRASATRIEREEYYPRHIAERFRDRPVSCGRLVRNPDVPGGSERMTEFMAASWTDLIAQGVRIEISNAIDKLLPYYRSLGYIPLGVPTSGSSSACATNCRGPVSSTTFSTAMALPRSLPRASWAGACRAARCITGSPRPTSRSSCAANLNRKENHRPRWQPNASAGTSSMRPAWSAPVLSRGGGDQSQARACDCCESAVDE